MTDIACDLLASEAAAARRTALDIYFGGLRGTPNIRAALEPWITARSAQYRALRGHMLDAEFWDSFSFVGKGQPWDHWYFHLVLGTDPDPRYRNGVALPRRDVELEVGL